MSFTVGIVGGSSVGLSTALAMQHRGYRCVLYYEKGPGEGVTADHSAGIGTPFCHPDPFVQEHFYRSYPRFMLLARDASVPHVMLSEMTFIVREDEDLSWASRVENFTQLSETVVQFLSYTFDPVALNRARLEQFIANGGKTVKRALTAEELAQLRAGESLAGCDYTVCAMGLQARDMSPDLGLYPTRGIIVHYPRRDDSASYMDQWSGVYTVSRPDAYLVAGTFEPHVGSCTEEELHRVGNRVVERSNRLRGTNFLYQNRIRTTVDYRPTSLLGLGFRFGAQVGEVTCLGGQGLVTSESLPEDTVARVEQKLLLLC